MKYLLGACLALLLTTFTASPASAAETVRTCGTAQVKITHYSSNPGRTGGVWIKSPSSDVDNVDVLTYNSLPYWPYQSATGWGYHWSDSEIAGPSSYWKLLPESSNWLYGAHPNGNTYFWKFNLHFQNGTSCWTSWMPY